MQIEWYYTILKYLYVVQSFYFIPTDFPPFFALRDYQ